MTSEKIYFQDYMTGNVCFGCGKDHPEGLQVKSYWEGTEAVCQWQSQEKYQGWKNILNGGIMASLIDCHCMGTAIAHAYRLEQRELDTLPVYRYATGTLTVKYLKPTPNDAQIELRAKVICVKKRKTVLSCQFLANGNLTATAEVVAIRVYDSRQNQQSVFSE